MNDDIENLAKKFRKMSLENKNKTARYRTQLTPQQIKNFQNRMKKAQYESNLERLPNMMKKLRIRSPSPTRRNQANKEHKRRQRVHEKFEKLILGPGRHYLPVTNLGTVSTHGHTGISHPLNINAQMLSRLWSRPNENLIGSRPNLFMKNYGILPNKRKENVRRTLNSLYMSLNNSNKNKQNYIRQKRLSNNKITNKTLFNFQRRIQNIGIRKYRNFQQNYENFKKNMRDEKKAKELLAKLKNVRYLSRKNLDYKMFNENLRKLIRNQKINPNHPFLKRFGVNIRRPLASFSTFDEYKKWVRPVLMHIHAEAKIKKQNAKGKNVQYIG